MTRADGSIRLRDGAEMPLLGFGTWRLAGRAAYEAVATALEVGYRHIDTATFYANEAQVGAALADSGVYRGEVFVTTKCPAENLGRERVTLEASLRALGTDYVDLWLVHWPPKGAASPQMWKVFLEMLDEGKARSVGVSNYSTAEIDELTDATGRAPEVNQIPWSPSLYDPVRVAELADRAVALEGYSGIKRSSLDAPVLVEVAAAHGVTPAQVVLRWHIEHGVVVIPKSAHRERIEENFNIFGFALDSEEIARIDGLASAE